MARNVLAHVQKIVPDLERAIGKQLVKTSESVRRQFAKDEGHFIAPLPGVVVEPTNTEQVSEILKVCNEHKVPVVPFGTGTGLEGGSLSTTGGVCLSLQQMTGEPEVHPEDFIVNVRPATTRLALNEAIKDTGLFFPVDPGADASVCGMVATSASGTNAIRYGTMKENVVNLEVVVPNGTIINTKGKDRYPRKSAAGYNLTELFVGSEGTLGVITEATIKVHPRPLFTSVAVCPFPSVFDATSAVVEILQWSIPIARIEFLDKEQVAACNTYSKLSLNETPTLFMEFHGKDEADVAEQSSTDPEKMKTLWKARHNAYYAALSLRTGAHGFTTDVCVPISQLAQVVTDTRKDLNKSKIVGCCVGHVGDGNFHVIMPMFEEDEKEVEHIQAFSDRLVRRALAAGGTCTGEHGIGIGKKKYMTEEYGQDAINLMKTLKASIDPNNIMNPGKLLP